MAPTISAVSGQSVAGWLSPTIAPLVVAPRETLTITGPGITSTSKVYALGVTIGNESRAPLVLAAAPAEGQAVLAPTVADLETTNAHLSVAGLNFDYAYERNQLLIPLAIQVEDSSGARSQIVVLGVQLPPPSVGRPRFSGRTATCGGTITRLPDTNNLGGSARGEVRWYGPSQALDAIRDPLPQALPSLGLWDAQKLFKALIDLMAPGHTAPTLWKPLVDLRSRGALVRPQPWLDNAVTFEVPLDPTWGCWGIAVMWRDDIPGQPLLIDLNIKLQSINGCLVVPAPPIGGVVPLIAAPRSPLAIQGAGIKAGARVVAVSVPQTGGAPLTLEPVGSDPKGGLSVRTPTLADLQRTEVSFDLPGGPVRYAYRRNALIAPLVIRVLNTDGTCSLPVAFCASLPAPALGQPMVVGAEATFGGPGTVNLGRATSGEIHWYGRDVADDLRTIHVEDYLPADLHDMAGIIRKAAAEPDCLPPALADTLARLRRDLAPPATLGSTPWSDDAVSLLVPDQTPFGTVGLVVAWRDDIPSVPVPVVNLYFDCSPAQQNAIRTELERAVNLAWSCLPRANVPEITVPVLPGATVPVILQRVSDAADNVVSKLFDDRAANGFQMAFWFDMHDSAGGSLDKGAAAARPPVQLQPNTNATNALLPAGVGPSGGVSLELCVRPTVVRAGTVSRDPKSIADCATIDVQLKAAFHPPRPAPGACWISDIALGPRFRIHQKPLEFPTVAVFFTGNDGGHCHHNPLFVLPRTHGIPGLPSGAWWDVTGMYGVSPTSPYDTIATARRMLLDGLALPMTVADVMSDFLSWPWLNVLRQALQVTQSVVGSVIDTTGKIDDLGARVYATDALGPVKFGKAIESVLLIGPPYSVSNVKYVCRDVLGTQTGGSSLTLSMPDGKFIAYIPMLGSLDGPWAGAPREVLLSDVEVPVTGPRSYASRQWGGCMASIEVVEG
jgi:hypothetical protein